MKEKEYVVRWRIGVSFIFIALAVITMTAVFLSDRYNARTTIGAVLIFFGGGLICFCAYNDLCAKAWEMERAIKVKNDLLSRTKSAIANFIELKITDDVQKRNELCSEEEKKNYYPIRIDREGGSVSVSTLTRYGKMYTPMFHITVNVGELNIILRTDSMEEEPEYYSFASFDALINSFRNKIRDCKFPKIPQS